MKNRNETHLQLAGVVDKPTRAGMSERDVAISFLLALIIFIAVLWALDYQDSENTDVEIGNNGTTAIDFRIKIVPAGVECDYGMIREEIDALNHTCLADIEFEIFCYEHPLVFIEGGRRVNIYGRVLFIDLISSWPKWNVSINVVELYDGRRWTVANELAHLWMECSGDFEGMNERESDYYSDLWSAYRDFENIGSAEIEEVRGMNRGEIERELSKVGIIS